MKLYLCRKHSGCLPPHFKPSLGILLMFEWLFPGSSWYVCVSVVQSCLTLFLTPWTVCSLPRSSVHGVFQTRILDWVAFPFSKGSSQPGINSRSPTLQADSLPAEQPGKPRNTGVGSHSLLQGIFPPRNQTGVSCTAGGFFTSWATWMGNYLVFWLL